MNLAQLVLVAVLMALLAAGLVHALAASRTLRGLTWREGLALLGLFGAALATRLASETVAADGQLASAQGFLLDSHRWGAAYSALLHALYLFVPGGVPAAAGLNRVLGALGALALFAFVDRYLEDRTAAFAAGAFLAFQPVAARYAATDSPGSFLVLCLLVGATFLVAWARDGGRLRLLQAAGWMAVAANVRLEATVFAAAAGLILLGCRPAWSPRRTAELRDAVLLGAAFLVHPLLRILQQSSLAASELSIFGLVEAFFLSPHSPRLAQGLALAGLAWALATRSRRGLWFLGALAILSVGGGFILHDCANMAYRYALPHLAGWAVFTGLGVSAAARAAASLAARARGREPAPGAPGLPLAGALAILVLAAAASAPHRDFLQRTWTHAREYEFLRQHLGTIPDDCRIVVGDTRSHMYRGLRVWPNLDLEVGARHAWHDLELDGPLEEPLQGCTVFYRSASCYGFEIVGKAPPDWPGAERPVCRDLRRRFRLEPLATGTLPVAPYMCEAYTVDPVPVGFFRLRDLQEAAP